MKDVGKICKTKLRRGRNGESKLAIQCKSTQNHKNIIYRCLGLFIKFIAWANMKMWKLELLELRKLEKHANMTQEIQMDHDSCEKDGLPITIVQESNFLRIVDY
jgi:hypothetical protein